jgi:hypothetical protein
MVAYAVVANESVGQELVAFGLRQAVDSGVETFRKAVEWDTQARQPRTYIPAFEKRLLDELQLQREKLTVDARCEL